MNVADNDVHTVTVANVRRRKYKSLRGTAVRASLRTVNWHLANAHWGKHSI